MARSIYSDKLRHRTNRLRLAPRKKPYRVQIAPGVFLCYRRNATGPGSWSVHAGWLKRFSIADDYEDANNATVMSYHQAQTRALKLVRGSEGSSDKPVTVADALDAYETDLAARGGSKHNAISVRNHCSPAMLAKVVMLLGETELRDWRNGIVAKGLKPSSASRIAKSFKAALALSAKRDKRVTNGIAWRNGLKPLKAKIGNAPPRDNYYLPDGTILAIVRECYVEDADFGALIDVLAGTGVRESQALKLWPDDLLDADSDAPRLMMWCSNKGAADRDPEQRALSITPKLAEMLRARAIARGPRRFLSGPKRRRWLRSGFLCEPFRALTDCRHRRRSVLASTYGDDTDRAKSGGLPATPTSHGRGMVCRAVVPRHLYHRIALSDSRLSRRRRARHPLAQVSGSGRSACLLRAFRPTNATAAPGVETVASGDVVIGRGYVARPTQNAMGLHWRRAVASGSGCCWRDIPARPTNPP